MAEPTRHGPHRVGLIGHGAIGRVVAAALANGEVGSASLVGIAARRSIEDPPVAQCEIGELIAASDVIVEAAGHEVVHRHAVAILEAGCDLIVVSVGALADENLAQAVRAATPGRVAICTGAIGGLDLLRAAAIGGGLNRVQLTTSKRPRVLIQPWMDEELATRLEAGGERIAVFDGTAREAAPLFPKSINVAATLALAVGDWDLVRVQVVADPSAELTSHVIEASGDAGVYRFEISNRPSPLNPVTSGIVAPAVVRTIADLCDGPMSLR